MSETADRYVQLCKLVTNQVRNALQRDLDGDEQIVKEVWEECRTEQDTEMVENELRALIQTLEMRWAGEPSKLDCPHGIYCGFCRTEQYKAVEDLEAQVLHWKKVAMQEAGFSPDVVNAICAPPVPLTPEELNIAQQFAYQWFARRKQP